MFEKMVEIVTQNKKMLSLLEKAKQISDSDCAVLIVGETGTGKEMFSDFIHQNSNRKDKPFIKVNLSEYPKDLLASELFGHEKGAFTGANEKKKGLFELADKGTLLLDDIDDCPLELQVKLLRFLENKEYVRLGGINKIKLDIRIISTTKVNLQELIKSNKFRSDLYHRLNVVTISIPPLRERIEDVPLLYEHYLKQSGDNKKIDNSDKILNFMNNYQWPGNVRELKNFVEKVILFTKKNLTVFDTLPDTLFEEQTLSSDCLHCFLKEDISFAETVACLEKNLIKKALLESDYNVRQAAKYLKLKESTLRDKINKHQINGFPY